MGSSDRIYRSSVRAFSFVFVALGLIILATTLAHGGGPLSIGTFLGLAFLAVGVARLWLSGIFRGWRRGEGGRGQLGPQRPPAPRDRTRGRGAP